MSSQPPRIALDAMGGDLAPAEIVAGAARMAHRDDLRVILVGDEPVVRAELAKHAALPDIDRIAVRHAPDRVEMDDSPTEVIRGKPRSSMISAVDMVRNGEAEAVISAGNSGAMMAASLLRIGRIKGISRPAFGAVLPLPAGPCLLIDAGANTDCKAKYLYQFGAMGAIYMRDIVGEEPRIGLVNVGHEEKKGSELAKEAHELMRGLPGFIGNIEGHDIPFGKVNVIVSDGFTGNVILKLMEGMSEMMLKLISERFKTSLKSKMGGMLAKKGLLALKEELDPEVYAGAPVLGVNGVSIISHGSASAKAIESAIRIARREVATDIVAKIEKAMAVASLE